MEFVPPVIIFMQIPQGILLIIQGVQYVSYAFLAYNAPQLLIDGAKKVVSVALVVPRYIIAKATNDITYASIAYHNETNGTCSSEGFAAEQPPAWMSSWFINPLDSLWDLVLQPLLSAAAMAIWQTFIRPCLWIVLFIIIAWQLFSTCAFFYRAGFKNMFKVSYTEAPLTVVIGYFLWWVLMVFFDLGKYLNFFYITPSFASTVYSRIMWFFTFTKEFRAHLRGAQISKELKSAAEKFKSELSSLPQNVRIEATTAAKDFAKTLTKSGNLPETGLYNLGEASWDNSDIAFVNVPDKLLSASWFIDVTSLKLAYVKVNIAVGNSKTGLIAFPPYILSLASFNDVERFVLNSQRLS